MNTVTQRNQYSISAIPGLSPKMFIGNATHNGVEVFSLPDFTLEHNFNSSHELKRINLLIQEKNITNCRAIL